MVWYGLFVQREIIAMLELLMTVIKSKNFKPRVFSCRTWKELRITRKSWKRDTSTLGWISVFRSHPEKKTLF